MKKLIIIAALITASLSKAQGSIEPSINQGENTLIKIDLQDGQGKYGYLRIGIDLETNGDFNRYGMTGGYTFNQLFIKYLELTPFISYSGIGVNGVGANFTAAYKINYFKIQIVNQYIIEHDFFVGVSYTF